MAIDETSLLDSVVEHYLTSGDFNGLYIGTGQLTPEELIHSSQLVDRGLIQVVTEEDYPNPHIRPWASRRSVQAQQRDLQQIAEAADRAGACLYPTPTAMRERLAPHDLIDQPYRRRMALGAGHLELAYFTLDVLENYRNDPRYHFTFSDCEVHFGIGDDAYLNDEEPDRDKISSVRAGFGYDRGALTRDEVRRFVATFIWDLARLTPQHQRRWETYEEYAANGLSPHPMWWTMMMGNWPDGHGPFERVLIELRAINELFNLAFGMPVFRTTERPREWGWVLRASTGAWAEFVLTTDKLLSDNLDDGALTAAGVPRRDDNGELLGSLRRLELLLVDQAGVPADAAREALGSLRRVRKERQKPAHALAAPATDATTAARQRDLLAAVGDSLEAIRTVLARHARVAEWEEPHWLQGDRYRL